ncbi:MAG: ArsR/SmtB family transcription factor [Candidatus Kerfeldbacteria bacterium]|jgi:ArsR family transcriptional regulator, lead/cadmium/zinc/bismuth-responsive transcriptional repressor
MILDKIKITKERIWLNNKHNVIKEFSINGQLLSDPTRIKILLLLKKQGILCVTDIADIIGISISAVSHQLSKLESMNFVKSEKMGKTVCYSPDKKITNVLKIANLKI